MIGVEIDERFNDDGFGFGREVVEDGPEDTGGAFVGFDILLVLDIFGGWKKGLRFYWAHREV